MFKKQIEIIAKSGLHARSASQIMRLSKSFKSNIILEKDDKTVTANNITSILSLKARQHSIITIYADGEDAAIAIERLAELIERLKD